MAIDLLHSAAASSWTNSAAPAAAALSNTVPSYALLDGNYRFVTVAGAATDYALFAYQVPAGRTLRITGAVIDASNTVAAVAGTPTLLSWSLSVGLTAATLVAVAGVVSRRIGLGMQSFPVGAAVGAIASQINVKFDIPIVCAAGLYVHTVLRLPVGTATATQEIAGNVTLVAEFG